MNVLDETSVTELEAIVKQTTADAAVKGVVITSSKEAFAPALISRCSRA